jgi:hypothetical protein
LFLVVIDHVVQHTTQHVSFVHDYLLKAEEPNGVEGVTDSQTAPYLKE